LVRSRSGLSRSNRIVTSEWAQTLPVWFICWLIGRKIFNETHSIIARCERSSPKRALTGSVLDTVFCGSHSVNSRTDPHISGRSCASRPGSSHLDSVRVVLETREGYVSILMRTSGIALALRALEFSGRSRPVSPPALCLFGDR
jgi:hypothetical protein